MQHTTIYLEMQCGKYLQQETAQENHGIRIGHIIHILLDLRQQACVEYRQSDENLDVASDAQELCGITLTFLFCKCFKRLEYLSHFLLGLSQLLTLGLDKLLGSL